MPRLLRILSLAGLLVFFGCEPVNQHDADFEEFAHNFVESVLTFYPETAIYAGRYENAFVLTIPDSSRRQSEMGFVQTWLARLAEIDPQQLSAANRTDYELIRNRLESTMWYQTEFRPHEWIPSQYNVAGPISLLLNTDYAPEGQRLRDVSVRLEYTPAYYAAAMENIVVPTLEHTQLAIQQAHGTLSVFGDDLLERANNSDLTEEEKATFGENLAAARTAVEEWIDFLENIETDLVITGNGRPYRIGAELYEDKFYHDIQSGYTALELYDRALAEKERLHTEMDSIATQLWPNYFPDTPMPEDRLEKIGTLIDHLSVRHVHRDSFFVEIERQIPLLAEFVDEHDLLEQDPTKPLTVRETPLYMRGSGAGASISAPGPFNPGAETYYNVTPLERFTDAQAESYLREYNHWVLQILNIHEAIPGHYTQLVHANKSPSIIKSLFRNGAMIEGWAVYSERMMLEQGWGDHEPEMWLMYGKWNLRVVCNAILDYAVHVLDSTEIEILDLLIREAFQETTEATEKWRRATLSQVQLTSYFAGYAEIYDFREEQKEHLGDQFVLRDFHNEFLSYGSAPVRLIRELMLED